MITRKIQNNLIYHLKKKEILLLIGARQVGKTTILKYLKKYLEQNAAEVYFFTLEDAFLLEKLNSHPEKIFEWKRKDRLVNKPRILADNARRRGWTRGETSPEVEQLYALRDFYRAMSLGEEFHVDHIQPLSKGGLHVFSNMQVIPAIDNLRKGAQ